jgi:exodeoxyribonuclease V alpha subunit
MSSARARSDTAETEAAVEEAEADRAGADGPPAPPDERGRASAEVFAEFCAAGLWPGLGRTTAGRLASAGITEPELVTAGRLEMVEGVGPKRAERLAKSFEDALPALDTAEVLVPCRVPAKFAGSAVGYLGKSAAVRLRQDPWLLLSLPQIRPDQADWFARQLLGGQAHPQDPRRGRAIVTHLLTRAARDGHTAVPADVIMRSARRFRVEDPVAAVNAAVDDGSVLPFEPEDPDLELEGDGSEDEVPADAAGSAAATLLSLTRYALAEEAVAEGLARLAATAEPMLPPQDASSGQAAAEDDDGEDSDEPGALAEPAIELDEAQQGAVAAVATHGVCVLAGGPGTGKSRTVAAVVALAGALGLRVALAAPTGRAAKRLEELAGAPATTLHRLLGAQGRSRGDTDDSGRGGEPAWVFNRCEEWPLDADLVVVDESSMLDAELAAALVEACADGTRLLFVGDPAQLPSIGAGRVLADIIDSGAVPVTELTTLYRQREGGVIARLATAVRGGDLPVVTPDGPGSVSLAGETPDGKHEAVVVPVRSSQQAAVRVTQLVTDSIPRALGIPPAEIQVVTPVHKGPAGTIELNRALKNRLNPGPGAHGGFDPGDRVVAIANHIDEGFANGEVGTVTAPADEGLIVTFTGVPVTVPTRLLSDLRHGWAMTVHRAQGSEWPAVVAVFPAEATGMLARPLVYTALTRAQRHLSIVHGAGPALARAVRTIGERPRQTRLADLLR